MTHNLAPFTKLRFLSCWGTSRCAEKYSNNPPNEISPSNFEMFWNRIFLIYFTFDRNVTDQYSNTSIHVVEFHYFYRSLFHHYLGQWRNSIEFIPETKITIYLQNRMWQFRGFKENLCRSTVEKTSENGRLVLKLQIIEKRGRFIIPAAG